MKKLSKIIILILSLAILCGALVIAVNADDTAYDLASAIDSAAADGNGSKTVKLTGDAKLSEAYIVDKDLTIDLNGYTFSYNDENAFVVKGNATLSIIGEGTLKLAGMIAKADNAEATPTIKIEGSGKGINVNHSGNVSGKIVSVVAGTVSLKNLKVVSTVGSENTKNYTALFETVYSTTAKVDMTLDNVEIHHDVKAVSTFFLVSVAGKNSHLTVKNSVMYTQNSGIFLGEAEAAEKAAEVALFENSKLQCVADYETTTIYGFFLEGYNWAHVGTVGQVNVKDSFVEVAGRPFYASYEDSASGITATVNLYNTEARCIPSNGSNHSEVFARYIDVTADKDTRISAAQKDAHLIYNTDNTSVTVVPGTRISILKYATDVSFGVTYPDGKMGVSDAYTWVFDPAGDPLYPYVLVEAASAPAATPIYSVSYTFEAIGSTPPVADDDTTYGWLFQANTAKTYFDSETFKNNATGMQFDIKAGSIYKGSVLGNSYVKFVVTEHSANNTHKADYASNTITFGTDPYMIIGGNMKYDVNKAHVQEEGGYTRAKVAVLNFDFGTDSDVGYPIMNVQSQARKTSSGGNATTNNLFKINNDGTLSDPSAKVTEWHSDVTLKPAGEWNHVTVVVYTDPTLNGNKGAAHIYINGELLAISHAYGDANEAYIMGLRFNIATVAQPLDASVCFDNISLIAYSEYLYADENDASSDADGNYLPDNYVTSSPAHKFIVPQYSVGGVPMDLGINEALAYAASAGKPLELLRDIKIPQSVNTDAEIITNGYEFNLAPNSSSCVVTYDENGNPLKFSFNSAYDAYKVNHYWYTGVYGDVSQMRNDDYYDKTVVGIGQSPTPLVAVPEYIAESSTLFKKFEGWSTDPTAAKGEEMSAVTISYAIAQGDEPVYIYPIYSDIEVDFNAYVVKSDKSVTGISYSDAETKALYKNLKDGETLVLLADFNLNEGNIKFDNPGKDPGVTIDNGYTDEELETMKANSAKIAVDVNGYTWNLTVPGNVAQVSRNTTLTVYSSRPGAYIYSRGASYSSGKYSIKGQRMFTIFGGTENVSQKTNVYNAHIDIGTTTVNDVTYPGSNLTLNGGVILEGLVGDNSCSITATNILALRGINDSSGMIMTRFYDGEIIVKDSIFIGPSTDNLIDLKSYDVNSKPAQGRQDGYDGIIMTPYVFIKDSIFINRNTAMTGNSGSLIGNNGDYKDNVCLKFENFLTNGRLNGSNEGTRNFVGTGVAAYNYAIGTNAPYEKAYFNQQLTLNYYGAMADPDAHIIAIQSPTIDTATGVINDNRYFYVVEPGYENLVPADAAGYIVLPVLERMSGSVDEGTIHLVTVKDIEGNQIATRKFVVGGNPNAASTANIPSVTLGAITLVHNGTYSPVLPDGVVEDITITANYDVVVDIAGFKTSMTIGSDLILNFYVPAAYFDQISGVTYAGETLVGTETEIDGVAYMAYSIAIAAKDAASDVVFVIGLSDSTNATLGTVTATHEVTVSLTDYFETILKNETAEYTEADVMMTWYTVNYINEANNYFGSEANEALAALLETYADVVGAAERVYENVLADTGLSAAFASISLKLEEAPKFIFAIKAGFAGTVTVTSSIDTYTFTLEASEEATKLTVEGLKAYELAETLTVAVNGTIGEEAIAISGQINLATFANYHSVNAAEDEASAEVLDLVNALYDYVDAAEQYKAGTLKKPEVIEPDDTIPEDGTTDDTTGDSTEGDSTEGTTDTEGDVSSDPT